MYILPKILLTLALTLASACSQGATDASVTIINLPGASVPDVEIDNQGVIHIAYLSDNNVYYAKSIDDGVNFSDAMRVNSEDGFAHGGLFRGPDLSIGKSGRVHIGWYNEGYAHKRPKSEWGFMYSRMNDSHTGFEATRNLSGKPCDNYSLAADDNGDVAVVWVKDGLFISRSKDDGKTFSSPEKTDADPCECCATRAIFTQKSNLFYLYRDKAENYRDMYLGKISKATDSFRPVKLNAETWYFNACPLSGNYLDSKGDHVLAAWELKGKIYYAQLNQEGNMLDPGEILVSNQGKYPVVLAVEDNVLVAWKAGNKLRWQLFDQSGAPYGNGQYANTSGSARPAGVVTSNGKVLLFP